MNIKNLISQQILSTCSNLLVRWIATPKVQLGRQDTLVCERSYLGYIRSNPGASPQIAEVLQRKVDPQRSR